jgi:hypothetical protein
MSRPAFSKESQGISGYQRQRAKAHSGTDIQEVDCENIQGDPYRELEGREYCPRGPLITAMKVSARLSTQADLLRHSLTTLTPSQLPHFREGPGREPEGSQLLTSLPHTNLTQDKLSPSLAGVPISADPEGQVRGRCQPELASSTNYPRLSLCTSGSASSVQGRGCPVGHANQGASRKQSQAPKPGTSQ